MTDDEWIFVTLLPEEEFFAGEKCCVDPGARQEANEFGKSFSSQGIEVEAGGTPRNWLPAGAEFLGDFLIKFAPTVGPVLAAAGGAWLHAKYGRKIRLKIGDIEAEAQTVEEVEKLLAKAQEIQRKNEPKKIHER